MKIINLTKKVVFVILMASCIVILILKSFDYKLPLWFVVIFLVSLLLVIVAVVIEMVLKNKKKTKEKRLNV